MRESGVEIARVEVDKNGKIIVIAGKPVGGEATTNEWDEMIYGKDKTAVRE